MLDVDLDEGALTGCLDMLDRQFDVLTSEAKQMSKAFTDGAEKKELPVVISVSEDKRYRSTTIRWCRVEKARPGSRRRVNLVPLRKGRDVDRYSTGVFDFVDPVIRVRVLHYEDILSLIRYSLARNRACYGQISRTLKGLEKKKDGVQPNQMQG